MPTIEVDDELKVQLEGLDISSESADDTLCEPTPKSLGLDLFDKKLQLASLLACRMPMYMRSRSTNKSIEPSSMINQYDSTIVQRHEGRRSMNPTFVTGLQEQEPIPGAPG